MNSEVEQRIVAMYFDNKDFEKNAKKTIDTLGELKDNLNLEDSVKGFEELNKAGKKLNLNDARTAVRNLRDSLGGLGEKIKNALNIGTGPLHTMRGFFDEFNGYVTKVAGIDLAGKIVSSFENAFHQLTTAPIEAGWNMYQQNVDSTKTIMSGTLQSYKKQMSEANSDWTYNEAEHMEYVKGQLKELSEYAQQTVFSLSDMTSNVGKFTNQGIDLETSVTAMEGIANMTAKAGQGAQQASMAMYNISQALGVGKMTTIDWKSIENANIATTELKDLFIQTAAAGGKLTKEIKKGADGKDIEEFFITVDKNGKKLAKNKWVKISAENFRDTLSEGWLDKETMLRVFQLYSNQVKDIDTLASWGFDTKNKELVDYLFGIGEEAELAATQVRTFQKMWDAMTEAVQSGWATSMEYIFGDMQEATTFWSTINEKIGSVLDASAKNRNDMLKEWRGYTYNENTKEWEKLEGAIDGREDLIQGIYGTIDAAKSLGSAFTSAWSDVFGNLTGKKLQEITKGFRDFIDRFKEWLGDMNDAGSRIRKIRTGLSGVFSVIKVVANVIKTGLGLALRVVKPLIDPILNLFEKFGKGMNLDGAKNLGEMLSTLRDRFTALWKKLTTLGFDGVFKKIGEWFSNLWEKIKIGVSDFLDENGLSGVKEWFIGIGDSIQSGYETVKGWWEGSGIPDFFKRIWDEIMNVFSPKEVTRYNGSMLETTVEDAPIVAFFKRTWYGLRAFLEEVQDWGIWKTIGSFFDNVWRSISDIFTPKLTGVTYDGTGRHETREAPIATFFRETWESVKKVFEDVKSWGIWDSIGGFFEGVWKTISDIFTPKLTGVTYDGTGRHETREAPIATFFRETWEGVKRVFEEVKSWGIWNEIGGFFEGVWKTISDIFTPKLTGVTYDGTGRHETREAPIATFFRETWEGVKRVFEEVKSWGIWKEIGGFFEGVWNTIAGIFTPTVLKDVYYDGTGRHATMESPIAKFFRETWESIRGVFEEVKGWGIWDEIGNFFSGIWTSIMSLFGGGDESTEVVKEVVGTTTEVSKTVTKNTPTSPKATEQSVSILERIVKAISGFVRDVFESINGVVIPPEVTSFFENLGKVLLSIMDFIGRLFGHLSKMLNSLGGKEDATYEWIVTGIVAAIGIISKVFEYRNNRYLSEIGGVESFAHKFMSLGVGILAIASAIALLTTVDQSKLVPAVGVIAVIGVVLGGIMTVLTKLNKTRIGLDKTTTTERVLTRLIGAVEKIGLVAVALALLPEVIRAFGEAKKMAPDLNGGDIMQTLIGVGAFIASVSLGLALTEKLIGKAGISPVAAIKTAAAVVGFITVILGGLLAVSAALDGIFGADNIVSTIEHGGDMLAALGGAISGLIGGLVGGFAKGFDLIKNGGKTDKDHLDESMSILEQLGDRLEIFTTDKTAGITRILTLVGLLSQTMKDVPKATDFTQFTSSLEPLAASIMKFGLILSGFTIEENQEKLPLESVKERILGAIEILRALDVPSLSGQGVRDFIGGLDELSKGMTQERYDAIGNFIAKLSESFSKATAPNGEAMATMSADLMKNLSDAIRIGMGGPDYTVGVFDAMPIIDSITTALGFGQTAIAEAVHAMVQAGIDNAGEQGIQLDGNFLNKVGENDIIEKILAAANSTGAGEATDGLNSTLSDILYGKGGTKDSPKADGLMGMIGDMENIKIPDISDKFSEAFEFKNEEGEQIDPLEEIKKTMTDLQTQIDEMPEFKITIVPTFDYRNLNTDAIRNALREYPIGFPGNFGQGGTVKVDMTELGSVIDTEGLKSAIANVSATVDASQVAIVAAINSVEDRIGSLSSAISNIKLYLDTGVLVGGITPLIDIELGRRARRASSTGVASTFGNPFAYMLNQTKNP